MTNPRERIQSAFRLNLEQQRKQAKELLKSVRAGDAAALARIIASVPDAADKLRYGTLKLADTQHTIARELRFSRWAELKSHIESLDRARDAIRDHGEAPDADLKTLHLRCGSDIQEVLKQAGFGGDFLEESYPFCFGPITTGDGRLEREAAYLVDSAGKALGVKYEGALEWRRNVERRLEESASTYERVVLWMEHDSWDQMALTRCLAHYARSAQPPVLELIDIDFFPGRWPNGEPVRFIGLGHLPEEALRLLWDRRRLVTTTQLSLATQAWDVLVRDDPRPLAALFRSGPSALSHLGNALHRLLQELPSVTNGLALTESLILDIVAAEAATAADRTTEGVSLNRLFGILTNHRDPLPLATDLRLLEIVETMLTVPEPVLSRTHVDAGWRDLVAITDVGRAVLAGERDWLAFQPPPRWVGGVPIGIGHPDWRWDETIQDAKLQVTPGR
ncbi:MAG TPA: DUF1835 domain-containing protein [Steroidobacteraceae bacterium]|jgi:hypothetical protein